MKNSEIRELSKEELVDKIKAEKEVLQKLRFTHSITPIENPLKIQATRRLIARLMTEHRSRELANQVKEAK